MCLRFNEEEEEDFT